MPSSAERRLVARRRVTLTFDNGPHAAGTPVVLEALARRGLKATFFLVAEKLGDPGLRALAQEVRAQGHTLANHTLTHGTPLGQRPEPGVAEREIGEAQRLLDGLATGRLFRPNGAGGQLGAHMLSEAAVDYLEAQGYTTVAWNCVPGDWIAPPGAWVGRALEAMQAQDWTLLVLHDYCAGTGADLERFLDTLLAAGYEFTQDFPPECVLLQDGRRQPALEGNYTPRMG